ncbi:MAG: sigma-70 family RNA polymerase sigma factor [Dehalococcoidia bacterium]|nr:sigma-70 family RNA polymerase sigma factor [Dehalococcoidia bacterium]
MGTGAPEARRRKEEALASLFETHYERIVRYIAARIGKGEDAEDLASQVFVRAVEALDSYEERGLPMQAWLFRIAHNLVVDFLRRGAHRQTVPMDEMLAAGAGGPEETVTLRLQVEMVAAAMGELTPAQRDVLALRALGGLTSEQAGKVLGKTAGAVREMQSSALKSLRRLLEGGDRP